MAARQDSAANGEGNWFWRIGDWVRLFLHGLWVARVSTVSVVVALILFGMVAPAQDLFIELKLLHYGFLHWLVFYAFAFYFWIVPVHFSARLALQTNCARMNVTNAAEYRAVTVGIPRLLSFLCFLAISIGIFQAFMNLPGPGSWTNIADILRSPAILVGLEDQGDILEHARRHLSRVFWISLVLAGASFLHLRRLGRSHFVTHCDVRAAALHRPLNLALEWLSTPERKLSRVAGGPSASLPFLEPERARQERNVLVAISFCLIGAWIVAMVFVIASAETTQLWLPRAIMVPILLGALVPGLTFLSVLSHRVRHPCVLYMVGVWVVLSGVTPTWHDIRCFSDCAPVAEPRQMTIEAAVNGWMKANNCSGPDCPPPIIVTGQGGASRAAFFTASVLTHLQETTRRQPDKYPGGFARQVFAISTVSGSALGAAVFAAALEAQKQAGAKGQALEAPSRHPAILAPWFCTWFGCHPSKRPKLRGEEDEPLTNAVQKVLAGDFLTPVFHALAFHDLWRWAFAVSRASTLEIAFERQFGNVLNAGQWGLDQPLSRFAPVASGGEGWRPLLVFNGTSVETGRRIVTSSLAASDRSGRRLFTDAHDFYERMCLPVQDAKQSGCPCAEQRIPGDMSLLLPACDIPLSTAVTNSARFPVVSPPGNIRSQSGKVFHRVVDGGYFENFGLLTATDLADAISRMEFGGARLKPFILQITNDPEAFLADCGSPSVPRRTPGAAARETQDVADVVRPFNFLLDPIAAVLNARTAHGTYATEYVKRWMEANRTRDHYARMIVCPELLAPGSGDGQAGYKELSLSWWISMPVQQYLHNQIYAAHNEPEVGCVLSALENPGFAGCTGRGQQAPGR
jgi:hypothetical protein